MRPLMTPAATKSGLTSFSAKKVVSERDRDAARLRFETALKEYGRARQNLHYAERRLSPGRYRDGPCPSSTKPRRPSKLARSNLKKIEVADGEVDAARAAVEAARAALDLAEIQLGYTELRAPFDGMIVSRNIEPGEVVSPGQEVISISDLSEVDLKIFVPETEIGKVKPGQPAAVKIDTFPDKTYHGMGRLHLTRGRIYPQNHPNPQRAGQAGLSGQNYHSQSESGTQNRNARRCLVPLTIVAALSCSGCRRARPIVEVRKVTKQFGSLVAVSETTFVVRRGRIVGLVGSDGAGKTTLLRMIATMTPPTARKHPGRRLRCRCGKKSRSKR